MCLLPPPRRFNSRCSENISGLGIDARFESASGDLERKKRFRVTHPFHPLYGQEIGVEDGPAGGEFQRFRYRRQNGSIAMFPRDWTDQAAPDPFLVWASGRAIARAADLLKLSELVRTLQS